MIKVGRKKGCIPWNKGIPMKQKTKTKISKAKKGYFASPETRKKLSIANSGKNHYSWKGGIKKEDGYILVYKPDHPFCDANNYIRKHRLVVERQIGRNLIIGEVVHHLGKINNNKPNMLMAFVNNSAHQRFHKDFRNVNPEEIIFDGRKLNQSRPPKPA